MNETRTPSPSGKGNFICKSIIMSGTIQIVSQYMIYEYSQYPAEFIIFLGESVLCLGLRFLSDPVPDGIEKKVVP